MIMKKTIQLTQILLTFLYVKCSLVIDEADQQGININDYCPKIGNCEEGTHVVCTHYNPKREMSPNCINYKNVTMTQEYADFILNTINAIRSRIARGVPMGNITLPRGYGIFRLQWDAELATFAQLWANQCILAGDYCRATKKFPEPQQVRSATFFTMDWIPQSVAGRFNYTGFSHEKVKYGIESTLNFWYKLKYSINDMESVLKGQIWDESVRDSPFLQIIQGSATHIGCGVAAYQYTHISLSIYKNVNAVRMVCNLSTGLRKGTSIYTMEPPTEIGYTKKCGCPLKYDEDASCLCYKSGRGQPYSCKYGKCMPNVVVLPIFTVEDKPLPTKNTSNMRRNINDVTKYHPNTGPSQTTTQTRTYRTNTSIFAKSPVFELPRRRGRYGRPIPNVRSIISPRREFSDIENAVSYFRNRRNFRPNIDFAGKYFNNYFDKVHQNPRNNMNTDDLQAFDYNNTELVQNEANEATEASLLRSIEEQREIQFSYPIENRPEISKITSKDNSDRRLRDLLNELEEEAKSLHIGYNEKDIFDKKIKKIYGNFIVKSHNIDEIYAPNRNNNEYNIADYDKTNSRLNHEENDYHIPLNHESLINNRQRNIQAIAPLNQNRISTRKVIYLTKRRNLPNINEHQNFRRRNYLKNKKANRIRYYGYKINDGSNYNIKSISPDHLKSKWRFRRPQKLTFS